MKGDIKHPEVPAQKTDNSIQEITETMRGVRMADLHHEFINHVIPGADIHACEPKFQNVMEPRIMQLC